MKFFFLGPGHHNVACSFLFKLSSGLAQGVWASGNASIWIKTIEGGKDERVGFDSFRHNFRSLQYVYIRFLDVAFQMMQSCRATLTSSTHELGSKVRLCLEVGLLDFTLHGPLGSRYQIGLRPRE